MATTEDVLRYFLDKYSDNLKPNHNFGDIESEKRELIKKLLYKSLAAIDEIALQLEDVRDLISDPEKEYLRQILKMSSSDLEKIFITIKDEIFMKEKTPREIFQILKTSQSSINTIMFLLFHSLQDCDAIEICSKTIQKSMKDLSEINSWFNEIVVILGIKEPLTKINLLDPHDQNGGAWIKSNDLQTNFTEHDSINSDLQSVDDTSEKQKGVEDTKLSSQTKTQDLDNLTNNNVASKPQDNLSKSSDVIPIKADFSGGVQSPTTEIVASKSQEVTSSDKNLEVINSEIAVVKPHGARDKNHQIFIGNNVKNRFQSVKTKDKASKSIVSGVNYSRNQVSTKNSSKKSSILLNNVTQRVKTKNKNPESKMTKKSDTNTKSVDLKDKNVVSKSQSSVEGVKTQHFVSQINEGSNQKVQVLSNNVKPDLPPDKLRNEKNYDIGGILYRGSPLEGIELTFTISRSQR